MTKSKTDKQLTLSYKITISRIDVPFADLLSFAAKEKNKQIE